MLILVQREKPRQYFKFVLMVSVLLFVAATADAQETKQFSSAGTTFSYTPDWTLEDTSTADVQQVSLYNKAADAVIQIIILKKRSESKTAMADLKKQIVDPWVEQLVKQYTSQGVAVERAPAAANIGTESSEGLVMKFTLDGQPGGGEALWCLMDKRLVLLYFVRPDKTADKATAGWDVLRKSLATVAEKK